MNNIGLPSHIGMVQGSYATEVTNSAWFCLWNCAGFDCRAYQSVMLAWMLPTLCSQNAMANLNPTSCSNLLYPIQALRNTFCKPVTTSCICWNTTSAINQTSVAVLPWWSVEAQDWWCHGARDDQQQAIQACPNNPPTRLPPSPTLQYAPG